MLFNFVCPNMIILMKCLCKTKPCSVWAFFRVVKFHVRLFDILKEICSILQTLPELDPRLWLPISVNVLGELEVIRDILVNT